MAHDGSQKNSSRKATTRGGPRKPARKPPRFGRQGHLAHLHHLLPLACVELAPGTKKETGGR
jgi:hypothetical protein